MLRISCAVLVLLGLSGCAIVPADGYGYGYGGPQPAYGYGAPQPAYGYGAPAYGVTVAPAPIVVAPRIWGYGGGGYGRGYGRGYRRW